MYAILVTVASWSYHQEQHNFQTLVLNWETPNTVMFAVNLGVHMRLKEERLVKKDTVSSLDKLYNLSV
jgi:hypothetical protein